MVSANTNVDTWAVNIFQDPEPIPSQFYENLNHLCAKYSFTYLSVRNVCGSVFFSFLYISFLDLDWRNITDELWAFKREKFTEGDWFRYERVRWWPGYIEVGLHFQLEVLIFSTGSRSSFSIRKCQIFQLNSTVNRTKRYSTRISFVSSVQERIVSIQSTYSI